MLLRQTRQLRRLVDDLLDLGRILAGKFTLRREPVSLDRLLRQSIATLGATGQLVGHVLRADLEPISCDLDPARIEQVFINLLNNAIKYTPEGGSIQVSLARRGDAAELRVADTGIGIPPDQIERVFELFVQAEPADGRAASGLGVGLSMARLLVEAHGGTIRARSEGRGCGTEMIVRIPCDAAPRPDGPAPRPA
jgi:signal transduction histidine kinase